MVCNAWIYCGAVGGCQNTTGGAAAARNACSLYYASDLDYNVPLDKYVGVTRAPNVTFTSGMASSLLCERTVRFLPEERAAQPSRAQNG